MDFSKYSEAQLNDAARALSQQIEEKQKKVAQLNQQIDELRKPYDELRQTLGIEGEYDPYKTQDGK